MWNAASNLSRKLVTRISSSTRPLQKYGGWILGLAFLLGSVAGGPIEIVPFILFLFAGAACLFVWWRYAVPAKEVFMDANNLYVASSGAKVRIPFSRILGIRTPLLIKNAPIIVTFEQDDGKRAEFLFIPSFVMNGGFSLSYPLLKTLNERVEAHRESDENRRGSKDAPQPTKR